MSERRFVFVRHATWDDFASLGPLTFVEAVWRAWWYWRTGH